MKNIVKISIILLSLSLLFCCRKKISHKLEEIAADQYTSKKIFLTFDDGPSAVTQDVLQVLNDNGVTATFFVCGVNVAKYSHIIKQIYNNGHTIGIHTNTHNYKKIYTSPDALKEDIIACISAIKGVLPNYSPVLYRFPGGSFGLSAELKSVPTSLGLTAVDWNASCRDCEIKPSAPSELVACAMQTAGEKNNVIMLLHDGAGKQMTALALSDIIKNFKEKDFSFFSM